jgi:hypothetical protein
MGCRGNLLQDGFDVAEDLLVREPQNHIVLTAEVTVAALIARSFLSTPMDLSINFHDEPTIPAAEVRDEGSDDILTKELQAIELPAPKSLPEGSLRWGQIPTELTGLLPVCHLLSSDRALAFSYSFPSFSPSPGEGGREGVGEGAGG